MTRVVLGLAGRRGSGKTTLARALEVRFGFSRASFGDYVRSVAATRAMADSTSSLESLGESLVRELGWEAFCSTVLAQTHSDPRVVVDSIRHVEARDTIANLIAPGRFLMAFVEVDEDERLKRLLLRQRPGDDLSSREMTDELPFLKEGAEIVVHADEADPAGKVVSLIETYVRGWKR